MFLKNKIIADARISKFPHNFGGGEQSLVIDSKFVRKRGEGRYLSIRSDIFLGIIWKRLHVIIITYMNILHHQIDTQRLYNL